MLRKTWMAVAAAGLVTATAPAFAAGVGMASPIGRSFARPHLLTDQHMPRLPPSTRARAGECSGAGCNGGNAGVLFGDGGAGARIGKPKFEDMKLKTGMGMGRQRPATPVRASE